MSYILSDALISDRHTTSGIHKNIIRRRNQVCPRRLGPMFTHLWGRSIKIKIKTDKYMVAKAVYPKAIWDLSVYFP